MITEFQIDMDIQTDDFAGHLRAPGRTELVQHACAEFVQAMGRALDRTAELEGIRISHPLGLPAAVVVLDDE